MMNIEHRLEHSEFVILESNQEATLKYRLKGESQVEFISTYVPLSLRGRGIAEALVQTGLQWAKSGGYEISSRCWYVDQFL